MGQVSGDWRGLAGLHLGQLHAQEQLLVLLVAFGPFVALVVVVLVLRRRQAAGLVDEEGRRDEPHDRRTGS